MVQSPAEDVVQLQRLRAELSIRAREGNSGRASHTVYGDRGSLLRQTLVVLLAGEELAEHESPPEATVHVLDGRVRLVSAERAWELTAGELAAVPRERHSVEALEDSAFLLTARRGVDIGALGS